MAGQREGSSTLLPSDPAMSCREDPKRIVSIMVFTVQVVLLREDPLLTGNCFVNSVLLPSRSLTSSL
jgi:hypothetical protein